MTACRWLIVYDNAEDPKLLLPYWPAASHGQALITTRNRSLAFEPAGKGLEISSWDANTGAKFLIHLLSTNVGEEIRSADSAYELSKKLSGHALAISHMAGLIHRQDLSIEEFMKVYTDNHGVSDNASINAAINAIWELSFRSLDDENSALLGVMCFLEPDKIPQDLFEPANAKGLPGSLSFCNDHSR